MIKQLFIALLFACVGSHTAAASQLVFGLDTTPDRLLPLQIKTPQTFPLSMQIFQGLFDLNGQGEVIPCLVEKWETKDYQTWIFHVRKGVHFHRSPIFNGEPREVTADDVVYSLTQHSSAASYNAFLLTDSVNGAADYNQGKVKGVQGVEKIDQYTVKVELIRPERFFINRLSTTWITVFPREMDDKKYADEAGFSIAVGTGPYVLKSRTETEVVLERNKNYWDKKHAPQIDKIIYRVITNDQTRLINLQRGNIDMMVLPSTLYPSAINKDGSLKKILNEKFQAKVVATYNTHFVGINNKMVPDVNLRRAMFWGTNRKEMINAILSGLADETGGTVPPGMNGYHAFDIGKLYDPEKAKSYLKKSSYKGEPLELYIHNLAGSEQVGQVFQAQMASIGINIVLKQLDFNGVIGKILKGEAPLFSMFMEYVFSSPEPILINFFSSSKIPVPNFFQFSNAEVDNALKTFYTMTDSSESVKESAKIEAQIMEYAPAIFLYRQKCIILYPKTFSGLEVSGNNHYFLGKLVRH